VAAVLLAGLALAFMGLMMMMMVVTVLGHAIWHLIASSSSEVVLSTTGVVSPRSWVLLSVHSDSGTLLAPSQRLKLLASVKGRNLGGDLI
jgi:hypothetical protein